MKLDMNIDEYLPLREVVFHTLRKAIIQGELQPGERLMEVTLASAGHRYVRQSGCWSWKVWLL